MTRGENRIIQMQRPMDEEQLKAAADLINQRVGNDLSEVKALFARCPKPVRASIITEAALELANAAIETEQQSENVVVAGEASLRIRRHLRTCKSMLDAFERKRDLLELMERCSAQTGFRSSSAKRPVSMFLATSASLPRHTLRAPSL